MKSLKDAWMMLLRDFRNERIHLLTGYVFMLYLAFSIGALPWQYGDDNRGGFTFPVDFMMITLTPMIGFFYSRRSFKYLSEDSYTQMLAYYRSLPITVEVVYLYRTLQAMLMFVMNGTVFYILLYLIVTPLREQLTFIEYLAFVMTWIGYGLVITGLYIAMEFLHSGKSYCIRMLLFMFGLAAGVAVVYFQGGNVLYWSIEITREFKFLSPLLWITIVLGVLSLTVSRFYVVHRLKTRDLY